MSEVEIKMVSNVILGILNPIDEKRARIYFFTAKDFHSNLYRIEHVLETIEISFDKSTFYTDGINLFKTIKGTVFLVEDYLNSYRYNDGYVIAINSSTSQIKIHNNGDENCEPLEMVEEFKGKIIQTNYELRGISTSSHTKYLKDNGLDYFKIKEEKSLVKTIQCNAKNTIK